MQKKKAGEWYIRLENEFRNNVDRCRFITLTFNKKSLEKYTELARKEIENKNKIDTKDEQDESEDSMQELTDLAMEYICDLPKKTDTKSQINTLQEILQRVYTLVTMHLYRSQIRLYL